MDADKVLNDLDWHELVDDMGVSFGIFRYIPPQFGNSSDIELLYANKTYAEALRRLGFDPIRLHRIGYTRDGNYLDIEMIHAVKRALRDRVHTSGKLFVTSMGVWVKYFITPLDPPNCYSVVLIDIDKEQQHLLEAERLGTIDSLTGAKSRNALETACGSLSERDLNLGVLLADVNGLKQINDTEGHRAGDAAIARAAQLLREGFPSWDLYRYGGDEFVVLAPAVSESAFTHACERFAASLAEGDASAISVGFAWGASSAHVNAIIRAADDAMYEQKRAYYATHDRRRQSGIR